MTRTAPLIYSFKKILSFCSVPNEKEKALITKLNRLIWDDVSQLETKICVDELCIDSCIQEWSTWLEPDIRLNALFFNKEEGEFFSIPLLFYGLARQVYYHEANQEDFALKKDYVFAVFEWLRSQGWDPMANEAMNGYIFLSEFFLGQDILTTTFEKFLELGGRLDTDVAFYDDEAPVNFYTRIWSEKVTDYDIYDEVLLEMANAYEDGKNWKGIRDGAFFIGHVVEDIFLVNALRQPILISEGLVSFKCESVKMRLESGRVITLFANCPISYPDDQKKDKDKETSVFHYLFPNETSHVVIEGMEQWDREQGAPKNDAGYVYLLSGGKVLSFQFSYQRPGEGRIWLHDVSENEFFSDAFRGIQKAKKLKKIRSEAPEA